MWLCVERGVPCGRVEQDVIDCVAYVVLVVEVVVICCRCDYLVHGEIYGGLEDGGREHGGVAESKMVVVWLFLLLWL